MSGRSGHDYARRNSFLHLAVGASLLLGVVFIAAYWEQARYRLEVVAGLRFWHDWHERNHGCLRENSCPFVLQAFAAPAQLLTAVWTTPGVQSSGSKQQCGGPLNVSHPILQNNEPLCREYKQVCFDQQTVISFDSAFSPANGTSEHIPTVPVERIGFTWAGGKHLNSAHATTLRTPLLCLPERPAEKLLLCRE